MTGFERLADVVREWTPERQAEVTGIAAATLRELVTAYLAADGAALYASTGVNQGRNGTLAFWVLEVINAITGNLDRRGGTLMGKGIIDYPKLMARAPMVTRHSRIGDVPSLLDSFPMALLADEILTPGPGPGARALRDVRQSRHHERQQRQARARPRRARADGERRDRPQRDREPRPLRAPRHALRRAPRRPVHLPQPLGPDADPVVPVHRPRGARRPASAATRPGSSAGSPAPATRRSTARALLQAAARRRRRRSAALPVLGARLTPAPGAPARLDRARRPAGIARLPAPPSARRAARAARGRRLPREARRHRRRQGASRPRRSRRARARAPARALRRRARPRRTPQADHAPRALHPQLVGPQRSRVHQGQALDQLSLPPPRRRARPRHRRRRRWCA